MATDTKSKSKSASAGGSNSKSLEDLFLHGIQDGYYLEKKLVKALPKMIKAAQSPALVQALTKHLDEIVKHVSAVEQVFSVVGRTPKAKKCAAMDGILDEADEILEEFRGTQTGDAAIIFSGQAVEHYEITRYGSPHAFAMCLV
jgi:ferritin-like metal-binding protein YciE